MGDFIRFLVTSDCTVDLSMLEAIFKALDDRFSLHVEVAEPNIGELLYQSEGMGEIEINRPGDVVFDEDTEELIDRLDELEFAQKAIITQKIHAAKLMVAMQLTEAGHEAYDRIDPLWDSLFDHCEGLLQIDEEGFYDQTGLITPEG